MAIELGSSGDYVKAWQRLVGVPWNGVDGNFGPQTQKHVQAWQQARGVDPDGVVGQLTRAAVDVADFIKAYEGLRTRAYDDHDSKNLHLDAGRVWRRPDGLKCIGYPTIGWGRQLYPGEDIETCTVQEAEEWLRERLKRVELPALARYLTTQDNAARAAAAAQCYNCGDKKFAQLAKAEFSEEWWTNHGVTSLGVPHAGLKQRRREEYALFTG